MTDKQVADPASYARGSSLGVATAGPGTQAGEGAVKLHPIERAAYRATIEGYSASSPMHGYDGWQCFELSWLNARGQPQIAAGYFALPLAANAIVESKSLKLYLNSLNQQRFLSSQAFAERVSSDLSELLGQPVDLQLFAVNAGHVSDRRWPQPLGNGNAVLLDELEVSCSHYQRDRNLLAFTAQQVKNECLVSHCLRSNCPVTNQPDWATLAIRYSGQQLQHSSVLRYIASYREHSGFHEQTVEQIFCDLAPLPGIEQLCIEARYTRRGGIAINPLRSTHSLDGLRED